MPQAYHTHHTPAIAGLASSPSFDPKRLEFSGEVVLT